MQIYNPAALKALAYESVGSKEERYQTITLKGTFEIIPGEALSLIEEPNEIMDLTFTDEYYGESDDSSIMAPSDLAYFKPNADIINGIARSKENEPLTKWPVNVKIGNLEATLEVSGPRKWVYQKETKKWSLTDPESCNEVELRYEAASGGSWGDEEEGGLSGFNPVGRGCCKKNLLDESEPILAPQILGIGEDIPKLGETVEPKGFGAITPSWDYRLQYAGTYDQAWIDNRHPLPPDDFKYDFFNVAHPDLIYPGYLQGGELVSLDGFSHEGSLEFRLPKFKVELDVIFQGSPGSSLIAELDTLLIDVEAMRAYLTWRAFLPIVEPAYGLNIHMNEVK